MSDDMAREPDARLVAGFLRGLPPEPLPPPLAEPGRIRTRGRLLAQLASTAAAGPRGHHPVLLAGVTAPAAAAVLLLLLLVGSATGVTDQAGVRQWLDLMRATGLAQVVALTLASGIVLAVAIVLPLVLAEE